MVTPFLKVFVGETPKKTELFIILGVSTVLTGVIAYANSNIFKNLPIWMVILFLIVTFDILGGAIGNFTQSTQIEYKNNPKKRVSFYFEHLLHIGLLTLTVGHGWYSFSVLAYSIIAGLFVNFTESLKQQEIYAATATIIGVVVFYVLFPAPQVLIWMPAIFFIKIVMGFSVKRER